MSEPVSYADLGRYIQSGEKFNQTLERALADLESRPLYLYREVRLLEWIKAYKANEKGGKA